MTTQPQFPRKTPIIANDAVNAVLARLQNVKKSDAGWTARCPAHEDHNNSLSIGVGLDGRVLLNCFAGCAIDAILKKTGMTMRDLFSGEDPPRRAARKQKRRLITVADLAREKNIPEDFLRGLGLENRESGVLVPYRCADQTLAPRQRIRSAIKAKEGSHWLPGNGRPMPYGLDRLADAQQSGFLIIPEGESDCWTLWHHGFPGLGVPGARMTDLLEPEYVEGIQRIYVVEEPDEAGVIFTAGVQRRLREIGWKGKLFVAKLSGSKDINDLHRADPAKFPTAFQKCIEGAAPVTKSVAGTQTNDTSQDLEIPYEEDSSGLNWFKPVSGERVRLSNFTARIAAEVVRDDGADTHLSLEIEAAQGSRTYRFTVPAPQFSSMNWVLENLGANAVIFPGSSTRDHTRAAIQLRSGDAPRRTIFAHVGWRKIDAEWAYLHGGGAVGANGKLQRVEVFLPAALGSFVLPDAPGRPELINCWRASISLLEIAADTISVGLFLAIWRSVLATSDFSVHLAGATGVFKTELAALAMQHFGSNFDSRHLPASWSSTGNSLEGLAFIMKDALLVVDDFCPTGSTADVQRYHREADRILRAQRNNAGRHRMRSDASLRPSKPPRGLIMSTGEDSPRGQSLRAGMLILEVAPTDVNQQRLTRAQADASNGKFAKLMAGFLTWTAGRYEATQESLRSHLAELRLQATNSQSHRRTPEIVANLMFGLDCFLEFGREIGAVADSEAAQIRERCWNALGKIAEAQTAHLRVNEPTQRFLELLSAAITAGQAHVAGPEGHVPENPAAWGWRAIGSGVLSEHRPQGNGVGWVDGDSLYLDLDCAVAAAQNMARDLGDSIVVAPRTLAKRLKEKGVLKETSDSRQTTKVRRVLGGRRREVLHLAADTLGNLSSFGVGEDHIEPTDLGVVPHADDVLIENPTTQPTTARFDECDGSGELVGLVGSVEDNPPHKPLALSTSEALGNHRSHLATGVMDSGDLEDVSGEEIL